MDFKQYFHVLYCITYEGLQRTKSLAVIFLQRNYYLLMRDVIIQTFVRLSLFYYVTSTYPDLL